MIPKALHCAAHSSVHSVVTSQLNLLVYGKHFLLLAWQRAMLNTLTRDTVASVGIIPQYLPFVSENNSIRYLRHALALDERRVRFLPSFCVDPRHKAQRHQAEDSSVAPQKQFEDEVNDSSDFLTDVQEVWFAGVHTGIAFFQMNVFSIPDRWTDVGGGSVKNDTPNALARIPLRWIIRECFKCKTGIIFDAVMLQQIGLNIHVDRHGRPVLGEQPDRIRLDQLYRDSQHNPSIKPYPAHPASDGRDRKSTRLNSSHSGESRMPSSA